MDPDPSTSQTPAPDNEYTRTYERLRDVPAEVLASRLVGSLILQKGNLNMYKVVLTKFIESVRAEYTEHGS